MELSKKMISAVDVFFSGHKLNSVIAVADDDMASVAQMTGATKVSVNRRDFAGSVAKILEGLKHPGAVPALLVLPLAGCGGGGTTAVDDAGDGGIVFDGYLVGATVYREGSDSSTGVTTATGGVFESLTGSGDFVVVGGTDASTGLAFTGQLKAPDGYGVVSPLTTMVEALIASGTDATTALADVTSALGLTGVDLSTLDPIATGNTEVFKAGVQVSSMLATASSGSASGYATLASSLAATLKSTADAIAAGTGSAINVGDSTSMQAFADSFSTQAASDGQSIDAAVLATIKTTVASVAAADNISSIASAQSAALSAFADQGTALKGPLHQAIVFNDYNGDGELTYGESWTTTNEDGSYALAKESNILGLVAKSDNPDDYDFDDTDFDYDDYSIVVSMGEDTIDYSSGESYADAGVSLKAAPGGAVITPMTTLHEHSEEHADSFQVAELAEALGIDSSKVNILTFNTHADGVDEELAHQVETIQQHLMTTTMMVQAAIKGSGTPAEGTPVSTAVAHDAALDSLIKLIIEVHKANNEEGGSDEVAITGELDLSDHEHLEELEELIEADLADTSEGGFGKTMLDNGTSVPTPVLEYVLEHASHVINLINSKLDELGFEDFGSIEAGAISHLKHDIADQIEAMATAARAHYDDWLVEAIPGAEFNQGTADEETGIWEGGDWEGFDPDAILTLNSVEALSAQIDLNKVIVSDHLIETGQAVAVLISGESSQAFDSFEEAYEAAVDGDTIELGSGEHALTDGSLTIEKELTIKGANSGVTFDRDQTTNSTAANYDADTTDHQGYGYIDSDELVLPEDGVARAGGAKESYINGSLIIASDNVSLDGLRLDSTDGPLLFDNESEAVIDNFSVKNSYIIGYDAANAPTLGSGSYVGDDLGTNWLIQGNIIGGVVSGTGGSMYLSGITNTETDETGDLGLVGNMFWRPAAGHLYLSSLTDFAIENNNFYHGLHADGADLDGLLSDYFTSTSGYSSVTPYGYGYGADGRKTVAYGADGEVIYYIDAQGRPRELSAEDGYGAIYTFDANGKVLIPYGYSGTANPDGFIELDAEAGDTAAIVDSSSDSFYGRNYWFELKGVNNGIEITGNTGAYNSGGIQFYGEQKTGDDAYEFNNITISNNLFTEMYNADPNGLMQTVYQNGKSGLLGPITISLNETHGASAENISITGNIIDIPVNQIYGSYDYVSGVQVRGDVAGLEITSNTITFTNTVDADDNLAQVDEDDTVSAYNSVVEGIKLIGGISGAIDVSGNTFGSDLTATQSAGDNKVELRLITIDGFEANYGDVASGDVTSLDLSDQTVDTAIATDSLDSDIGLLLSSLPGVGSENFDVTSGDFEVVLLSELSFSDAMSYFKALASSNIGVARSIDEFTEGSKINVAEMLQDLGYSTISPTASGTAGTLSYRTDSSLGAVYDGTTLSLVTDLGDNEFRADARLVDTTDNGANDSTLVTLLYDADSSAGGSIEYSYRQMYLEGDQTATFLQNDSFNYGSLELNAAPQITSDHITSVNEDSAYSYTITTRDAEGKDVTLSVALNDVAIDEADSWLSFSGSRLSGTPSNSDVGTYTVAVTALDADGQSATETFTLEVVNTNDAPEITITPDLTASQGETYVQSFTVSDDDDGDALDVTITVNGADITAEGYDGWALSVEFDELTGSATLSGTPSVAEAGTTQTVVITASDGEATATETLAVAVSEPPNYFALSVVEGFEKVVDGLVEATADVLAVAIDLDEVNAALDDPTDTAFLKGFTLTLFDDQGLAFDSGVLAEGLSFSGRYATGGFANATDQLGGVRGDPLLSLTQLDSIADADGQVVLTYIALEDGALDELGSDWDARIEGNLVWGDSSTSAEIDDSQTLIQQQVVVDIL